MAMNGLKRVLSLRLPAIFCQVRWSHYRPGYVEPTFNKAELEKMYDDGIAEDKAFLPVKAAQNNQHNSVFRDALAVKFTNIIMKHGKRELARELMEMTIENVKRIQIEKYHKAATVAEKEKIELNPFTILHKAVENCKPVIALTPIKRGGSTYQVPIAISDHLARFRAMKWLLEVCKDKKRMKTRLPEKLSHELVNAYNNEGRAVQKKQDLHQQCEANKAYAHYRWN